MIAWMGMSRSAGLFRVMTLNAWFRPPLDARITEMAAWVEAAGPHVICLQEVEDSEAGVGTLADRLASLLPNDWYVTFAGFPRRAGALLGTAVLSRWPIEDRAVMQLACEDATPKSALHARTAGVDIFSVHLTSAPDGAEVRERQVLQLDEFVQRSCDNHSPLPPIVAGDFNATPGASAIRFLRGEQSLMGRSTFFQDAWATAGDDGQGHTWCSANPNTPRAHLFDARCDYVLVGTPRVPLGWSTGNPDTAPTGQVIAAHLLCHYPRTGLFASDHYGVTADICYPAAAET